MIFSGNFTCNCRFVQVHLSYFSSNLFFKILIGSLFLYAIDN